MYPYYYAVINNIFCVNHRLVIWFQCIIKGLNALLELVNNLFFLIPYVMYITLKTSNTRWDIWGGFIRTHNTNKVLCTALKHFATDDFWL